MKRWLIPILLCVISLGVGLFVLLPDSARSDSETWTDAESTLARCPNRMYAIDDWRIIDDELVAIGPREINASERTDVIGTLLTADDEFAADALHHRISMRSRTAVVFDYPREFKIIEVRLHDGLRLARTRSVRALCVSYEQ